MKRPPTDLEILELIYSRYYKTFCNYVRGDNERDSKIYVPINIEELADYFKIDGDIIHGRLYYHLEQKYGFTKPDGTKVPFFWFREDEREKHQVQFPLLASAIADLRESRNQFLWATWFGGGALVLSLAAIIIGFWGKSCGV